MSELTRNQQTARVLFLGVVFLVMFTTFNSLQNIVSKIYKEYGYDSLGETSILLLYFVFGGATFFSPFVIRKYGFRKVMFLSSLGYACYEAVGLLIVLWTEMSKILGWGLVLLGAILCGFSASMLWVAQGVYVNETAGPERKT
jgi:MFS family permease